MFEFDIVCQPWGFRHHIENNQQSVDRNCRHSFQSGGSHSTHLCFSFLFIFAVLGIRGTYFLTAFIVVAFLRWWLLLSLPFFSVHKELLNRAGVHRGMSWQPPGAHCCASILVPLVTAQLSCPGINPNIQNYILSIERVVMTQLSHILKYCSDEDT